MCLPVPVSYQTAHIYHLNVLQCNLEHPEQTPNSVYLNNFPS